MFYRTPDESIEATNRRIAAAAQDFLQRLEELVARADDALSSTLRAFDAHIHRRADEAGSALGDIVGELKRAASELNRFHIDGSGVEVALGVVTQTIGEASRRASENLAIAGQASERLAQTSQSVRDSAREAATAVGQAVTQLAAQVDGAAAAAEVLTLQFGRIGAVPERLDKSVAVVGQAFESLAKRLGEQFDATVSGASLVSESLTDLSKKMSGLSVSSLHNELSSLEASLGGLRKALEGEGRGPDAQVLTNLTAALEQTLAGAKRLNEVLDEIVEAVKMKLDNVR